LRDIGSNVTAEEQSLLSGQSTIDGTVRQSSRVDMQEVQSRMKKRFSENDPQFSENLGSDSQHDG
jgi:hypothetical protein